MKILVWMLLFSLAVGVLAGCDDQSVPAQDTRSADQKEADAQQQLQQEAVAETGMPAIKNFREKKLLKTILELRDQDGLITYTYLENEMPKVTPGRTALGGKLTYLGESIGYGIPYATQYTNPGQAIYHDGSRGDNGVSTSVAILPQADPNSLYSPSDAEGTWIMMKEPGSDKVEPQYIEPRIAVFTYKLPSD